jgi:RNA polymerase sigma-70 factor (ECF subfamily)
VEDDVGNTSDEAVLVAAAQTDLAAFDALYRRYLPVIYRYLRARARTPEDAADLTQHVFLRAIEALPTYQERGLPFGAWLLRIARNAAVDASRRRRRFIAWQHVPETDHPPDPEQADPALLSGTQAFDASVATLTDDQRELLILRFAVGLTTREIAHILGKTDGAVRMQLSRTLMSMKEHTDVE